MDWLGAERAALAECERLQARGLATRSDSLGIAAAYTHLALARDGDGRWWRSDTRTLAAQAVDIRERLLGPNHPEVAASLLALGRVLWRAVDFAGARAALERAHTIGERALGADDPRLADVLEALGLLLLDQEDQDGAKALLDRALGIRESTVPADPARTARTLRALGDWHTFAAQYDAAQQFLERALSIQERELGVEHLETTATRHSLLTLLDARGDTQSTRAVAVQALAAREGQLEADNPQIAQSLDDLAGIDFALADYASARALWERALNVYEHTVGDRHPDLAAVLTNLATLAEETGDYRTAHAHYERALHVYEVALGPDHTIVAILLSQIGRLARDVGDSEEARSLFERALRIREQTLGPNHPTVASSLARLAGLYHDAGDWRGARPLLERALSIYENAAGPDHPFVGSLLNSLALTCEKSGDYDEALRLYERAMAIYEKQLGAGHPWLSSIQLNVAEVLRETNNPQRAFVLLQQALATRGAVLGEQHPDMAELHERLALVHAAVGDEEAALSEALAAEQIARGHLRLTISTLPERQALGYAAAARLGLHQALSLAATAADGHRGDGAHPDASGQRGQKARTEAVHRVWDALVQERALVLDEMADRRRAELARAAADQAHDEAGVEAPPTALLDAYRTANQELATLLVQRIGTGDQSQLRAQLDEARHRREQAERALARASADFRARNARTRIDLEQIAAALPADAALVAYVRYDHIDVPRGHPGAETRIPAYLAFVLATPAAAPQCVALGDAARIDALIDRWREEAARGPFVARRAPAQAQRAYDIAARELGEAVWQPVARLLGDAPRAFVVLDGQLHLVNLNALPARAGGYLLERGPLLHLLNAERDLVPVEVDAAGADPTPAAGRSGAAATLTRAPLPAGGLLALGGPAFDAQAVAPDDAGMQLALFRGALSECATLRGVEFPPLPGSLAEVDAIAGVWAGVAPKLPGDVDVVRLTGADASEGAVKRLAPGRRVLHLATHGFFLGEDCSASAPGGRGVGTLVAAATPAAAAAPAADAPGALASASWAPGPHQERNPLLLSGLALAGANRRSAAAAGQDDGILTAEEIAALDLRGVEWAVLSACDTGVGHVAAGEGVFGLRRALQLAGARTVVLSLWGVEDESARAWMEQLYRARLQQGQDTASAVRTASLAVLQARRAAGSSAHPFYWGGFIAAGDWR